MFGLDIEKPGHATGNASAGHRAFRCQYDQLWHISPQGRPTYYPAHAPGMHFIHYGRSKPDAIYDANYVQLVYPAAQLSPTRTL